VRHRSVILGTIFLQKDLFFLQIRRLRHFGFIFYNLATKMQERILVRQGYNNFLRHRKSAATIFVLTYIPAKDRALSGIL
jgi:hypothetical protein